MVAKFNRYPQRELVRKTASKLKGTSISLGKQFPKEIQERRKQLLPILRREKERGKRVVHRRETIPSRHRHVYRHAIGIRSNARRIQGWQQKLQREGAKPIGHNRKGCEGRITQVKVSGEDYKLKKIGWNIHGGFDKKWNNTNFKNFLFTYGFVCLSECWLEKEYFLEVP